MPSKKKAASSNPSASREDAASSSSAFEPEADRNQPEAPVPPHRQPLVPGTILQSERATKIKLEANLGRDLGIFGLLLVGLVAMSLSLGGVGEVDEETLQKRLEKAKDGASEARMWPGQRIKARYSEWSSWMGQIIKDFNHMPEEDDRCKLYVADSSIPIGVGFGVNEKLLEGFGVGPGYGYGLFAGKTIVEGDVVVDAGVEITTGNGDESYQMPQHAMIIKPHPTASNVKFVANEQHYVAIRDIQPGEELFVEIPQSESSYFSLFDRVPTLDSYALAQEILTNEMEDLTRKNSEDKIIPAKSKRSRGPNKKPKRREKAEQVDENSLQLIRRIVARFDPLAALLLPETPARLAAAKTFGIDVASLNNRTMPQVYHQGRCFDGVKPTPGALADGRKGALLTRNVTKGEIIISIPLVAATEETSIDDACFKIDDTSSSMLCSLSRLGGHIGHTTLDASAISESEENCEGCPNAAYNWPSWNPSRGLVKELGIAKASEDFSFALSLDVVATQDIKEGTEVLLQSDSLPKASAIAATVAESNVEKAITSEL
mmetsp:Transcript_12357/g.35328  ORF Transcript_12357/g.35328 Transcript_12357/m.35328 type:complete len:547 (-) Transcript_12357:128-1768(-)